MDVPVEAFGRCVCEASMTIHDFIGEIWKHFDNHVDHIQGLVQARDHIILITDTRIFKITDNPHKDALFLVELIGFH
jgi:formylmethanofuran dehydrogenase subunit A